MRAIHSGFSPFRRLRNGPPVLRCLAAFCVVCCSAQVARAAPTSSTSAEAAPIEANESGNASGAAAEALIELVIDRWNAQRDEIATVRITFRNTFQGDNTLEIPPEKAKRLFLQHNPAENPDAIGPVLTDFYRKPPVADPPWSHRQVEFDGLKMREESPHELRLADGELDFRYTYSNEQIDVMPYGGGPLFRRDLTDFRWLPPEELTADSLELLAHHSGRITLRLKDSYRANGAGAGTVWVVDERTGVVREIIERLGDGSLRKYRLYDGLVEWPGGIVFPTATLQLDYRDGLTTAIGIKRVMNAEFNIPIPPEQFVLPVPVDTTLVDYRGDEVVARGVRRATDDVHEAVAERLDYVAGAVPPVVQNPADEPIFRQVLLVGNAVMLFVIGGLLWRRSRRSAVE